MIAFTVNSTHDNCIFLIVLLLQRLVQNFVQPKWG